MKDRVDKVGKQEKEKQEIEKLRSEGKYTGGK